MRCLPWMLLALCATAAGAQPVTVPPFASKPDIARADYDLKPRQIAAGTWVIEGEVADFSRANGCNIINTAFVSMGEGVQSADVCVLSDKPVVLESLLPSHEDMIFAIVSLDPHHPQETSFEIPLWEWNLPDSGALQAEDLMTGARFTLHGKAQWLRSWGWKTRRSSRSAASRPRGMSSVRSISTPPVKW